MRVYLASRYSRYLEMQKYRADLQLIGHTVTSRWINGGHEMSKEGSDEAAHLERQRFAREDLDDLASADCVISFTESPRTTATRGGRHVEHGVALATGKRVIVVGHRENVFHSLPQVEFYEDWTRCFTHLLNEPLQPSAGLIPGFLVNGINNLALRVHDANHRWWHDLHTGERLDRNKGELLMLMVSEISEAMEGERKGLMDDKLPHRSMAEVEMADTVIRILDYCGAYGYDLEGAIREKLAFNAVRKDHQREARLAEGGKKW